MAQVEGELKSMEEYFEMYKDGVSQHDLQNYMYVIKVKQPGPPERPGKTTCTFIF
jgi:hypothetical protein